jgi:hypothetical protein
MRLEAILLMVALLIVDADVNGLTAVIATDCDRCLIDC